MPEQDFKKNLAMARMGAQASTPAGQAKLAVTAAKEALSLPKYIEWGNDWPYFLALLAGILKDLLDFVGIGSLPAIGTVISICISIFIGFMMLLAGSSGKRKIVKGVMKRYLTLIGGTIAELLFGLNFLPIETIMVIAIYIMVLAERKQAEAERKKQQALEGEEGMEEEYA